jgi:phage FluMu protein Com
MNTCYVSKCRFPTSHVTKGHKCGKCNNYGHGIIECGNRHKILKLQEHHSDTISNPCTFGGCSYKHLHTTDAHHCSKCNQMYHSAITCPTVLIELKCPICKQVNNINFNQKKISGLTETCSVCLDNKVDIFLPGCGHACLCNSCFNIMTNRAEILKYLNKELVSTVNNYLKPYPSYVIICGDMGSQLYIRRLSPSSPIQEELITSDDLYERNIDTFVEGYAFIETPPIINNL